MTQPDHDSITTHHGEYKVPGGKLLVADLEVARAHLQKVRLSGDFFLEPDEALESINAALEGAPITLESRELSERITAALPAEITMVGISVPAIATVIRRALARASDWRDHHFTLIHRPPESPRLHMALDEILTREVAAGRRGPILRVWEWDRPAIIIGSFQSLTNEVDPDAARAEGVEVVRRISGGGAMFVEPGNTITWSLIVPESLVQGLSFVESYAFLDDWVIRALGDMGVQAWYVPINDITSPGGKIAGAAQKRLNGAVLHHVTMAYDIDADKLTRVLRIGREKLSDKGTTSAGKRVDPLRSQTGLDRDTIIQRMADSFANRFQLDTGTLSEKELEAAHQLAESKFAQPEWTGRIP
ncbi:lipoate--protein ligase family protein [Kushneria phosphatilytica]|uniref:Lipoate--protein ligase family protein n=1 Tax=Kushneria phosphatilytica TaxID=657387 RepID=A0A1S1NXA4_9GAMM|nr:biotin/lipoate A/B protein ligase family protein [Kushneria phosphatilytica]OHV08908.1 lipoate--protein ligase [Kushneria phosphatilytica]QEL12626.1 lipoate--protein ligase family protein [Kushneria phosphatilytica]